MANFKTKEHFNTDEIVSILFIPERVDNGFEWIESRPIKKFFGLINTGKFTQAGWFGDWDGRTYTDEQLRNYGYKVYTTDERVNDRVCKFAKVKVYLTHDNEVEQTFETDEDAEIWVEHLKTTSGKNFAVATYDK